MAASAIHKQPGDPVDLWHALDWTGDDSNQSQDVRCFVTDPANAAVSGSPFALTHSARGVYRSANAYSAVVVGTYHELYIVYASGQYPSGESTVWNRSERLVDVKYEAIGASGGGDVLTGDFLDSLTQRLKKDLPEWVWRFNPEGITNPSTAYQRLLTEMRAEAVVASNEKLKAAVEELKLFPQGDEIKRVVSILQDQMTANAHEVGQLQQIVNQSNTTHETLGKRIDQANLDLHSKVTSQLVGLFHEFSRQKSELESVIIDGLKQAEKNYSLVSAKVGKIPTEVPKLEVNVKQFTQEVSKQLTTTAQAIISRMTAHVDKRTTKKELTESLQKIIAALPALATIEGIIHDLNAKETKRLNLAIEYLAKLLQGHHTSLEKVVSKLQKP